MSSCEGESSEDVTDAPPPTKRIKHGGTSGHFTQNTKLKYWHEYTVRIKIKCPYVKVSTQ